MTENSKKNIKDVSEKENSSQEKKTNNVKYQYSVKLSADRPEQHKEPQERTEKVVKETTDKDTKEVIGKIATAKIAADQVNKNTTISSIAPQRNLPAKLQNNTLVTLGKVSIHGLTIGAKSLLKAGDLLISLIVSKNHRIGDDVVNKARPPIVFGIWVIIVTFLIAGIWSGFAPLDSSAGAQGFVVVASKKQIIQHREGGIIEAIYVKEGESVQAGQPLIKLSDKSAKAQLEALLIQKESFSKQLSLIQSQLESLNNLYEKGFIQKDKIIQIQSQEAQALGHIGEIDARILTSEEALERITIKAPVAGTVNQLQVHTIGGTVGSGMTLMTIIPKEDDLIVEAYLAPQEIESVYVGLPAKVRISAFKSRTTAPLNGIVTFISSDVVEPPQYQAQEMQLFQHRGLHYKVKISIDKKELRNISKYKDLELYPGMVAEVMIVTGERTLLQYLLDPVTNTFWHAFVEK
ncbi:MAG: HlyD family efflux transporter periplasmic adaptor subunit [Rickettsiales bacterium]|nr:HlyD family efflux transporter periplasmic adaptor subunit [Rickettsiales bacterium]